MYLYIQIEILKYDNIWHKKSISFKAMSQLGETNWEMEVAELKPIRNSLCGLFGIPPPIAGKKVEKP